MVIIKIMGGLGNQMFQYAFGRSLQARGKEVKYDLSYYEVKLEDTNREFVLEKYFDLNVSQAERRDIRKVNKRRTIKDFIRLLKNDSIILHPIVEDENSYMNNVHDIDDSYYIGYWQNERYFKDIEEVIKNEFKFRMDGFSKRNKDTLENILNDKYSVSIHIRGTDYNTTSNGAYYGGICNAEYYDKAVDYIYNKHNNSQFYIFSDDLEWAKKTLKNNKVIREDNSNWISWNKDDYSWCDMKLMSCCKSNIIANSSFSWWAAWLNANEDKIVIAPSKWDNVHEEKKVAALDWIII